MSTDREAPEKPRTVNFNGEGSESGLDGKFNPDIGRQTSLRYRTELALFAMHPGKKA